MAVMIAMGTLVLALWASGQEAQTATFEVARPALSFTHPASWTVEKDRFRTRILLPLADNTTGVAEIFESNFRQDADNWQNTQVSINNAMFREVERQWTEEILGVPLLMTRIAYTENREAKKTLVGLLFTATDQKFHFRLTAPAAVYDQAENAWREAMLTLRTKSGELPMAEYAHRPPEEAEPKPEEPKPRAERPRRILTMTAKPLAPGEFRKAAEREVAEFEGKPAALYLPRGWDLEGTSLMHKGFQGTLTVGAISGSPDDAAAWLAERARTSLPEFAAVDLREEPMPQVVRSGAILLSVQRKGRSSEGELTLLHAVGAFGDRTWTLEYRAKSQKDAKRDEARLRDLMNLLGVEWLS